MPGESYIPSGSSRTLAAAADSGYTFAAASSVGQLHVPTEWESLVVAAYPLSH
jgi:hypothetical protein